MALGALAPDPTLLAIAVLLDLALGDPQYRWHPIRLIGASVAATERALRAMRLDGYAGGIALGLTCAGAWVFALSSAIAWAARDHPWLAAALHVYVAYSLLALRDLLDHVWKVEHAARRADVEGTRHATSRFVARDTAGLDIAACRRAGIESLAENLTDGYVSPIFWYAVAGVPGLVAFKVFSTLDSMVGNKSERYLRFGWFSARTDDVLNWLPARLTWLLIAACALVMPRCSARKALAIGWRQHGIVPGPNSGWSEAATAGAIQRRLVGPIVLGGTVVTDLWLGDERDPPAGQGPGDVPTAMALTTLGGLVAAVLAIAFAP